MKGNAILINFACLKQYILLGNIFQDLVHPSSIDVEVPSCDRQWETNPPVEY